MILLDSNTIIYLSKELILVDAIFDDNEEYGVSVITYMEVLGYETLSQQKKKSLSKNYFLICISFILMKLL